MKINYQKNYAKEQGDGCWRKTYSIHWLLMMDLMLFAMGNAQVEYVGGRFERRRGLKSLKPPCEVLIFLQSNTLQSPLPPTPATRLGLQTRRNSSATTNFRIFPIQGRVHNSHIRVRRAASDPNGRRKRRWWQVHGDSLFSGLCRRHLPFLLRLLRLLFTHQKPWRLVVRFPRLLHYSWTAKERATGTLSLTYYHHQPVGGNTSQIAQSLIQLF